MPLPDPDALLRLADDLVVRIDGEALCVGRGARQRRLPLDGLAVLAALAEPQRFGPLLARLGSAASGRLGWIEASARIAELWDAGAIRRVDDRAADPTGAAPATRGLGMHLELLDDRERTDAFLAAIAATVRPGDVVVDLGSGSGVLAMAAIRAGAARVYAIEASEFAEVAAAAFATNGMADRITLLRGWSHRLELPERADLLVSEILGNDPLGEGVLRFLPDAASRFLKPGGRLLPGRLEVMASLLERPLSDLAQDRVDRARLDRWRAAYGFDFGAVAEYCRQHVRRRYLRDAELRGWPRLAAPTTLIDLALDRHWPEQERRQIRLPLARGNDRAALLLHMRLHFPDGSVLDSDPLHSRDGNWRCPLIGLPERDDTSPSDVVVEAHWGALHAELDVRCRWSESE